MNSSMEYAASKSLLYNILFRYPQVTPVFVLLHSNSKTRI